MLTIITTQALLLSLGRAARDGSRQRLLARLQLAGGVLVSYEALIEDLWRYGPFPKDPENAIRVYVTHLRKRGWHIKNHHGRGLSYKGSPPLIPMSLVYILTLSCAICGANFKTKNTNAKLCRRCHRWTTAHKGVST